MKMKMNRVAGLIVCLTAGVGASHAGDTNIYDNACLAPIAAYQTGLPAVDGVEGMAVESKLLQITANFREVMGAFQKVQACHDKVIAASGVKENFASIYAGAKEAGRVFELVQVQFEQTIEDMSGEALSQVAPAAGAGAEADIIAEGQTFTAMEIVMDSYMALEQAQEFGKSFMKRGR